MKSQQNEGSRGSTERSEVLLDVTDCNADSLIGSRGCKQIGLQGRVWGRVGIGLCSPVPTIAKLYGSVLPLF